VEDAEHEWKHKYELRMDLVPLDFFPPQLAQRVFMIGRAVRVLDRDGERGNGASHG
jgi:hypothetical protein